MSFLNTEKSFKTPTSQRRLATLLAATTMVSVGAFAYQTGPVQEWRLRSLDLPALAHRAETVKSDPRLLYHLGRRFNEAGRFTEADPVLRQAVSLEPGNARLRDEWTRALLGSGLVTAAFGQLQQFVGTHPDMAEAHLLLGKFYVTQNSMKRAQE